jgi:hypothetical protein
VNNLVADFNAPPFKTLDEAAIWLRDNRARLRQRSGS